MSGDVMQALGLVLVAAVMNACYTLPMKLNRKWAWEHSWLAFTVLGVVVVPTLVAVWSVPDLWSIYDSVPAATLGAMAFFGFAWGVSMVLFGLAIALVGVAITFTVCLGTSAASGALLPLLARRPEALFTADGALIVTAVVVVMAGVTLCAAAGQKRDGSPAAGQPGGRSRFLRGFFYALIAGVAGSLLNLGLAYGGDIQRLAAERGAHPVMMSNPVWLPCVYAGFLPGVVYCLYLMRRNGNLKDFVPRARWYYWADGALMGALWFGSILLYSLATTKLGPLGPAIGWPLFLSAIVIASGVVGALVGEWSHAGKPARRLMAAGVLCLVAAIAILSQAGR